MQGQTPTAEARPLAENVGVSDVDKMLNDYVKPAFIKMSAEKQKEAIDMLTKMAGS